MVTRRALGTPSGQANSKIEAQDTEDRDKLVQAQRGLPGFRCVDKARRATREFGHVDLIQVESGATLAERGAEGSVERMIVHIVESIGSIPSTGPHKMHERA